MKDVVIVGGGIVGCAIARELSKYNLEVVLLEKESDVASGISKANSGIIHGGFNEKEGTLKAKLNIAGNSMYDSLCKELDFNFNRNGSLVLAFNEEEGKILTELKNKGELLGVKGLEILTKEEVFKIENNISEKIVCALHAKTSGIINPYEVTLAFAENASENGIEFLFDSEVINIKKLGTGYSITLKSGEVIESKIIINSAGINSDIINNLINSEKYEIEPVKGEYCLLDKVAGKLVKKTIFQVPNTRGKGVLVTPTVDGNLLLGPTAKAINSTLNLQTTKSGLKELLEKANRSVINIPENKILTTFTGLRPHLNNNDFIIEEAKGNEGFITLVGIESPGLTAAPAIAVYVADIVGKRLTLTENKKFIPYRKRMVRFTEMSLKEKNDLISKNPTYGKIICKCELITEGEIIDSIKRPLGAKTVDGVKRRTRATLGGCQGVGCLLPISKIISRELGIDIREVTKKSKNSQVIGFKEV